MENCFWPAGGGAGGEYGGGGSSSWNYTQSESSALQYHFYNPSAPGPPWGPPFEGSTGDRTATASRSHSEAEKRRRDRINAQLATLRKLIPKSEKMDKAALLGHVVEHVKEQSKLAKEVSKSSTVPTETDEVIISDHHHHHHDASSPPPSGEEDGAVYMKASVCCDDRPELFAEINGAVKGIGMSIHQADITSIGGRMKSNLVLCAKSGGGGGEENACPESLKQSLKMALSRVVITAGSSGYTARSKRQRFFYPNYR